MEASISEDRAVALPFFFILMSQVVSSLFAATNDLYFISNVRAEPD